MALNHVTLDDNYDLGKSGIFPASTRTSPRPRCGAHSRPSCAGKASSTTCSGSILAYLYTPLLQCISPQLARTRRAGMSAIAPLLGDERTRREHRETDAHDPMYGPAVRRRRFPRSGGCGLASMYPASGWSVLCSGPPWISARLRSLYRTGLKRAIWVTSVRRRREDRPPSRLIFSQTSAGKLGQVIDSSSTRAVPLLVPCGSFLRPGLRM